MTTKATRGRHRVWSGAPVRRAARTLLGAVVVVGAAAAWQLTASLEGSANILNRHLRVDMSSADRVRDELEQLALVVVRHVAAQPDVTFAKIERQIQSLEGALALMRSAASDGDLPAFGDIAGARTAVATALQQVRHLLAGRRDLRGDQALLLEIERHLAPARLALRQLSEDLAHVRLELQDRDLFNMQRLVALNRDMLIAFLTVGALFIAVLVVEAHAAVRAERAARASERRFKDFADVASDWLWETDAQLCFTHVSGGATAVAVGTSLPGLLAHAEPRGFLATSEREAFRDLVCHVGADDERRTFRLSGRPMVDEDGTFKGYRGVGTDITDEVRREARVRFLAEHDQLTKLPNRATFRERLRAGLENATATGCGGALLALDLDGFKEINDVFGHDVGDRLLVAVTERLAAVVPAGDTLARLGGDEFAIVHGYGPDTRDDTQGVAALAILALQQPFRLAGKRLTVGVSIGIARYPADGRSPKEVMKAADLALYRAKADGRGCFRFFHRDMSEELSWRKALEDELRQAIEDELLQVFLQPQVQLRDGRLSGAEALVRWQHPQHGWVSPDAFVPIAEHTGLIVPLGRWVLETACRAAAAWSGPAADAVVAVNVSPAQFMLDDLVSEVSAILERTGLPPHRLELEVTEGLLMRDQQATVAILGRLRDLGVQLALDDFGTGYSSLSYLKRFPVDKVKIDKAFVDGLEHDQDDRMIAKAIVMLGQTLSLHTIAEGVETVGQSEYLTMLGCDQGQGYLFGRPMPAADFHRQFVSEPAPTAACA